MADLPDELPEFPPDPSSPPAPETRIPYVEDLVSWLGIAWIVAFLAGLWGAMLGIGKFGLSEFLFLLCGAIVLGKVAFETMRDKTRNRFLALIIVVFTVASLEFCVMHWTNGLAAQVKQEEKETREQKAKLAQLDTLPDQMQAMRNEQAIEQAREQQKMDDIGSDNKDLKGAIEKKDALLAAIAQHQYFSPQIVVASVGPSEIRITNNGQSTIVILRMIDDGSVQTYFPTPDSLAKNSYAGFTYSPARKSVLVSRAQYDPVTMDYRTSVDASLLIQTEDKKNYTISFTVTFLIKDGDISNSFVHQNPTVEITPQ